MAIPVEMPKMSDTMEEGVLVAWLAEEGQEVSAGDVIAQVETDKATMDLEVFDDGVLLKRVVGEGDSVPIGALIAILGKKDENVDDVLSTYGGASGDGAVAPVDEPEPEAEVSPAASVEEVAEPAEGDSRVKASPLARRMAADAGVPLSDIAGSGPDGRVIKRDVEAALGGPEGQRAPPQRAQPIAVPTTPKPTTPKPAAPKPQAAPIPAGESTDTRISQMRKTISRRLAESKFTAPHFYLTVDVDMAPAIAFRSDLNALSEAQGLAKISYNDIITKACGVALLRHPMVNASYLEDEGVIRKHGDAHVAVAVAMDEGLITPVIRNADRKGLAAIAAETRELAGRAREGKLDPSEYSGSTFTTSNLGMFGITEFTAIINPPNACILAIGAIRDVPVVADGQVVPGSRMTLTLSCDHRVVDGAAGSQFLGDVKALIEAPARMLL